MHRVLAIAMSFLAVGAAVVAGVSWAFAPAALARGQKLYRYRAFFDQRLADPKPLGRPLVAWLGNSTLLDRRNSSYPQLLDRRLRPFGVQTFVVAGAAFDPYVYYFSVGRLLEMQPRVVGIVAQLPSFGPKGADRSFTFNDVSSYLRPRQLPRTFLLPLAERGLSPARVLLAQSLNARAVERWFLMAEGTRALFDAAPFWTPLGPPEAPVVFDARRVDALRGFRVPLAADNGALRMLEATVRAVHEAGAVPLVIASPMPIDALRARGWYDATLQENLDLLRRTVERAGGTYVDLHAFLPREAMADFAGHFHRAGAAQIADALWPYLTDALGVDPDAGSPPTTEAP